MRKSYITANQNDANEVVITDLNEDSPSNRIGNENVTSAISDLSHLKDLFPHKNIYRISYRTGLLYPSVSINNIVFLTLKQLIR